MRLILLLFLVTVGCSDETVSGYADRGAVYRLIELDGAAYPARATIAFPEEGRAMGDGPCNSWSASQAAPYPWIELGPIAATRRACPELPAETEFFAALGQASLVEVTGSILILSGEVRMVFEAE